MLIRSLSCGPSFFPARIKRFRSFSVVEIRSGKGIAWTEEQLGILDADDPLRVPYIPSPDWSKDLIVEEDDFSHGVSIFSGAAGVEILTGVWIAKIAKAHRVTGLIDDLVEAGVIVTPDDVLKIAKRSDDTIIFLEKGNDSAGLTHIINRHADDFVRAGIPEERIADIVFEEAVNGTRVGTQGTRPIYEIVVNGKKIRVTVTVGDNGFIVGANPVSF